MDDSERLAWLRLIRTDGIGPMTLYRLVDRFGSARQALERLPDLAKRGGRAAPFVACPHDRAAQERDDLASLGGRMLCPMDPDYPVALAMLEDAPPVISVRGNTSLFTRPYVGIVGSRNASLGGRTMAQRLAKDLGRLGYVIVSGLARGIDTAAHEAALPTGTVAVLAGGVDVIYPPENKSLYGQIIEQGAVISEQPLGMQPIAQHFPKRNRIIAGLAQGVVIVEAAMKSGSLITARLAADQGREVFAVPGSPLDPRAAGPNSLIRDGATLVQEADDIVRQLTLFQPKVQEPAGDPYHDSFDADRIGDDVYKAARENVLPLLSDQPCSFDELVRMSGVSPPILNVILLEWELAGTVHRLPGNRIVRVYTV